MELMDGTRALQQVNTRAPLSHPLLSCELMTSVEKSARVLLGVLSMPSAAPPADASEC